MKQVIMITDEKFSRVAAALSELGVEMKGVCANEAYKLLRWHIKWGLDAEQLNQLARDDSRFHNDLGSTSYDGTRKFSLR